MNPPISRTLYFTLLAAILCLGTFVRFYPIAGFQKRGFDEAIYQHYVEYLDTHSLLDYPDYCKSYLETQHRVEEGLLPPTRFTYIYGAHLWRSLTGESARASLIHISALFGVLTLLVTAAFCVRLSGPISSLGVTALMSVSMSQIHQAQHAMIDGFFTFWCLMALWALWECLRSTQHPGRWMWIYGLSLAALVATKENSFFVFVGICGILASNHWLRIGTVTRPLILTTFAGALFGFAALVVLAGGMDTFYHMYRAMVEKSLVLPYAIENNDGPWYRYWVELMLVSPLITVLAIGAAFQTRFSNKAFLYFLLFIGVTFAVMANVQYGMNFRYATIWDMPLRFLAFSLLTSLAARFGSRATLVLVATTVLLCAFELRQYFVFCVDYPAYTLVPSELMRATKILK